MLILQCISSESCAFNFRKSLYINVENTFVDKKEALYHYTESILREWYKKVYLTLKFRLKTHENILLCKATTTYNKKVFETTIKTL